MRYATSCLLLIVMSQAAVALDAQGDMRAWSMASDSEKSTLLDQLSKSAPDGISKDAVMTCLDEASKLTAHGALPIAVVFKACAEQSAGQKV